MTIAKEGGIEALNNLASTGSEDAKKYATGVLSLLKQNQYPLTPLFLLKMT